jgi:exodeoxyribonuclease VII small subunit
MKKVENLSFEEAVAALQEIVETLENEQRPLEESLALFERGQALARRCMALLDAAELKVRQLTEDGEITDFLDA